jgi:DNA-directed RNA polymerase subunit alpha
LENYWIIEVAYKEQILMVSIADSEVDLFGSEMPNFEQVRKLAGFVKSSEANMSAFYEEVEKNQSNHLQAGVGLYILGRTDEAVKQLQKAPDCREKYMYLGYAFDQLGQCDESVSNFDKAAKYKAESLMVSLAKAASYIKAGKFESAAKELDGCSNFEKVSAEYHYQKARLLDAQGLYEEAIVNYRATLELDGEHQESLFQLAYACDLRGDEEAAIDYYKQIARTVPTNINALLNLAVIYEDRCEYDKASNCVEAVLKAHPNHKKALLFHKDIESSKVMVYDEEKEKLQDRHNKILEIPISDFELSVRSRNCLKKMKIFTIGDLLNISEAELLSYKNFGETSLMEIKNILEPKGLKLGMALEDKNAGASSAEVSGLEGVSEEILNKSVEDMELSVRARRALSKLSMKTLSDLITKTEAELLGCKNFGVTSLNEIKERLAGYGLSLRKLE